MQLSQGKRTHVWASCYEEQAGAGGVLKPGWLKRSDPPSDAIIISCLLLIADGLESTP